MALQITDTYKFGEEWAINVDFNLEEYRLCWLGSWRDVPDFIDFPNIHGDTTITRIPHSDEVHELWAKSRAKCYGADSHIRVLDSQRDAFPICKVATNTQQRETIRHEFNLLRGLLANNAPVVSVHPDPLVDEHGIFGFRMEKLIKIEPKRLGTRVDDIRNAIAKIHSIGIVHNDFHPGNLLQRSDGTLVVIDFGRSGLVGHEIPAEKRSPLWKGSTFSIEADKSIFKFLGEL